MPVYDYDLISAFPNIARDLIDIRDCYWKNSDKYVEKALYGYVKCKVTIYQWVMVHPIIQETKDGCLSPVGTWEAYLTKGELDFMRRWDIGEYEIIEGYWAIPAKGRRQRKPLKEPMEKLTATRVVTANIKMELTA